MKTTRQRGRPKSTVIVCRRVNVHIDNATEVALRAYGQGNLSLGIRMAAKVIVTDTANTD